MSGFSFVQQGFTPFPEVEFAANAKHLKLAFEEYGATVQVVTERDIGLEHPMDRVFQSMIARDWFLQKFADLQLDYDDPDLGRLFVFCYLGDGLVRKQQAYDEDSGVEWQRSTHLFATSDDVSTLAFDLTWAQQYLRDHFAFDVICIFECCFGSHDGMDAFSPIRSEHASHHKMWTLSAGPGDIHVDNSPQDMTRRLAANMR
ncbi:hypothetical protein LTR09_005037 [Extremus antarcticus]|uniref:Uncharacterized protein n=1 Tax=Extremus antarcticus TaxID=702011 RepID=A0AAJ0GDR1_9PEZI|nr:hypothetical protein LTR09_005037 [Extremus antarcticus]